MGREIPRDPGWHNRSPHQKLHAGGAPASTFSSPAPPFPRTSPKLLDLGRKLQFLSSLAPTRAPLPSSTRTSRASLVTPHRHPFTPQLPGSQPGTVAAASQVLATPSPSKDTPFVSLPPLDTRKNTQNTYVSMERNYNTRVMNPALAWKNRTLPTTVMSPICSILTRPLASSKEI